MTCAPSGVVCRCPSTSRVSSSTTFVTLPISPQNQKRYPPEWPHIRLQMLERAKWRCEHPGCQAAQYAVGRWLARDVEQAVWAPVVGNTPAVTSDDRAMHAAGQGLQQGGEAGPVQGGSGRRG